eukprot:gene13932-14049_t
MKTFVKVLSVSAVLAVLGAGAAFARMGGPMGHGPEGMYEHMCSSTQKAWDPAKMAERMTKKLSLTDAQKPLFADFHAAMAKSHDDTKASLCADKPDLTTAPGRASFGIKAMEAHLNGMKAVQPKLEAFYTSLTDAQKKTFDELRQHGGWHHGNEGRHMAPTAEVFFMSYDPNNIFAKILRGEIPCHKVFEDEIALAFMDVMPQGAGHTLVLPKDPSRNLLDIDAETLAALIQRVQKVAVAAKKAFDADGITLMQFSEPTAGQTVFHTHFHILPRFEGVNLRAHSGIMAEPAVLAEHAAKIRAVLEA